MRFPPSRTNDLLVYTAEFGSNISVDPPHLGLVQSQCDAFIAKQQAFAQAVAEAANPETSTRTKRVARRTAGDELVKELRQLVRIIQACPTVTDEDRARLSIPIKDSEPTVNNPPSTAPALQIVSVSGRTVTLRLRNAQDPSRRAKPAGCATATVLSHVGETAPENFRSWDLEGSTGRTTCKVTFGPDVPAGSKVFLTAFWANRKGQTGPAAPAVSTILGEGVAKAS